ncbi:MAG: type IV toxin-antitoxin system AbiEi family antitoxin domain-containing protein [Solirubrobacteraceae bacterium]
MSELAVGQWGVVSVAQLRELGVGRSAITRRVNAGQLHRLHPGVYTLGHTALRAEGHRLAAVLACGPGAVLSHRSAASHWGLLRTDQTRIDVTAPRGRHGAPGIRLHRSRSLDAQDTTHHGGIPITSVSRTLLDLASTARPSELERALAQTERLRLYDHRAIQATIARNNGHRGTQVLARATSRTPKWTKNEWEAEFLDLIRKAGLPEPQTNDAFDVPDHGHCEPDYHWPEHRVIVETDGFETHGTRAAFHADRAKDAALTASSYRVLRFTRDDDPQLAIKRLRAVLASSSGAQGFAR